MDDHHDAAGDHDDDYLDHDARASAVYRVSNDDVDHAKSLSHHQVNHSDDITVTLSTPGESNYGQTVPGE